jgi:hypothetical protein
LDPDKKKQRRQTQHKDTGIYYPPPKEETARGPETGVFRGYRSGGADLEPQGHGGGGAYYKRNHKTDNKGPIHRRFFRFFNHSLRFSSNFIIVFHIPEFHREYIPA